MQAEQPSTSGSQRVQERLQPVATDMERFLEQITPMLEPLSQRKGAPPELCLVCAHASLQMSWACGLHLRTLQP